ncbi:MAG: ABC transporter permease [Actinomycetia bacterium]|nr:ABC transporter permease [Actinomycetes bacterium]
MNDWLTATFAVVTIASAVRLATPYLLASMGEAVGQRSGVLNLGVDGVMLLGGFMAYWTVLETKNLLLGVVAGIVTGAVLGLIYATVTIVFHAEQGISGIGLYLFGLGMSELLFQEQVGTPLPIKSFSTVRIPLLADIPKIGEVLFDHSLMAYAAILLVPVLTVVLNKTTLGLNIRAVGENPEAVDSLGVSVARTRLITIVFGNAMAGLAGAALVIELGIFQNNVTNGMGFIAVALVYFGAWRPAGVLAGSLLYGLVTAIVTQWKTAGLVTGAAASFTSMAPAVLTVIALVVIARRNAPQPSALTHPFVRGH